MKIAGPLMIVLIVGMIGLCGASSDYQLSQMGFKLYSDSTYVNLTMNNEKLVINSTDGIVSVARIDGNLIKIIYVVIDKSGESYLKDGIARAVFFATGGENISSQFEEPLYFGRYSGLDLVVSLNRNGQLISEVFLNRAGVRIQQAGDYTMFYDAREKKLWHFGIVNEDGSLTEMTSDSLLGVSAFINATYTYKKIV